MQPVERYLNNLAKLLPADQREDILRELTEDIHSEIEEKESKLGRPLGEAEQIEILKRRGNPLQVAAGYIENRGVLAFGPQLIGPVLFPFYVRVLAFNLGLTFLILGSIFAALSLSGQPISFASLFSNVLLQLILQLTAVTVIFALVEKHFAHQPYTWDQKDFEQKVHAAVEKRIQENVQRKSREVSRFDSIAALIASSVVLLWLQSLWTKPFLIFGPAAAFIAFAPVWQSVYPLTVFLILVGIVRACVNIAQPNWVRFRDFVAVLLDLGSLFVIRILLLAHEWIVPAATVAASPSAQHLSLVINRWVPYALWASAAIAIIQTVHDLIRLYKNWRWSSQQ
jgi:hypothetical protein